MNKEWSELNKKMQSLLKNKCCSKNYLGECGIHLLYEKIITFLI